MSIFKNLFKKTPKKFVRFPLDLENLELDKTEFSYEELNKIRKLIKNNQFTEIEIRELSSVLSTTEEFINLYHHSLKNRVLYEEEIIPLDDNNFMFKSCCEFSVYLFTKIIFSTKFSNRGQEMKDFIWVLIVKTFGSKLSLNNEFESLCNQSFNFWKTILDDLSSGDKDSVLYTMKKVYKQLIINPMVNNSFKSEFDLNDFNFKKSFINTYKMTLWFTEVNKNFNEKINSDLSST